MTLSLYSIVGMKHRGTENVVAALTDGEPLVLKREPSNQYDRNAVQVWAKGQHVGYVRATQAVTLAEELDHGESPMPAREFPAKFRVTSDRWPMAEMDDGDKK